MNKDNNFSYTPLPEPIPITEQHWPEGTLPLVTTRTITYMHEPFIRECIEGILMQKTTFPVEVVIHDDASTDKTADIVREYQAKHPNLIQAIYQKENQFSKPGKGTMREDINKLVRGKYIALCEGDDYWTDPLKLQKQVEFLEGNQVYSACFTNAEIKYYDGFDGVKFKYPIESSSRTFYLDEVIMKGGGFYPTASIMFRREIADNFKFKPTSRVSGDVVLAAKLALSSNLYYMNNVTCVYRMHQGGVYSSVLIDKKEYLKTKLCGISFLRELNQFTNNIYEDVIYKAIDYTLLNLLTFTFRKSIKWFAYVLFRINLVQLIRVVFFLIREKIFNHKSQNCHIII